MIIGDCPYEGCDDTHWIAMGDMCGFSKQTCDACGKDYWLKHSRVLPEAFTLEEFNEKYVVDEENKSIELRNPPKPLTKEQQDKVDKIVKNAHDEWEHEILYGSKKDEGKNCPHGDSFLERMMGND